MFPESFQSGANPRFDGAERLPNFGGDLNLGAAFEIGEVDDGALIWVQAFQGGEELFVVVAGPHRLFEQDEGLSILGFPEFRRPIVQPLGERPQMVKRTITCDRHDPGAERTTVRIEGVDADPCAQKRLLHEIFGHFDVVNHPQHQGINRTAVVVVDNCNGGGIAFLKALDNRGIHLTSPASRSGQNHQGLGGMFGSIEVLNSIGEHREC